MASATRKERVSVRVTEDDSNDSEELSLSEDNSSNEKTVTNIKSQSKNDSDSNSSNLDSDQESNDDQVLGNPAWADAIAKVLRTKGPAKKVILSKAKKDKDIIIKDGKKNSEVEIVGEDGNKLADADEPVKAKKPKKTVSEILKRKEKKKEWEKMGRIKPSPLDKEKERALMKIGTKGVVQLFNAVQTHQRTLDAKLKDAGPSEVKKDKVLKSLNKGAFLDLLKTKDIKKEKNNDTIEEAQDASWSAGVFNENYMMGAKMRDWGKEIDGEV